MFEIDIDGSQWEKAAIKLAQLRCLNIRTACDVSADVVNIRKLRVTDSSDAC
jgi:hypothetical protein